MLAAIGKSSLERLGYAVTSVTDSTEALVLFKENLSFFDLVITDQAMPYLSGAELSNPGKREGNPGLCLVPL